LQSKTSTFIIHFLRVLDFSILVQTFDGETVGRPRVRWKENIKDIRGIAFHNIVKLWAVIWMVLNLQFRYEEAIQSHILFSRFLDELCIHIMWCYSFNILIVIIIIHKL
jgi:hypothetical protein